MKLTIEIEGTSEELGAIAATLSDGGGEPALRPYTFVEQDKFLKFDYSRCFTAWGYDPKKHGKNLVVTATVQTEVP